MNFLTVMSSFLSDGSGEINQAGVDHYNKLINALLAKGMLTIYV
jgi:beta-glucosidase